MKSSLRTHAHLSLALSLAGILLMAGLAAWFHLRRDRAPTPRLDRLQIVAAPAGEWIGFDPGTRQGLIQILRDCLDSDGRLAVFAEGVAREAPQGIPTLQVAGIREGDRLRLRAVLRERTRPERTIDIPGEAPARTLAAFLQTLGLSSSGVRPLVPRSPSNAWALFSVAGPQDEAGRQKAMRTGQRLLASEKDCASLHLLLALSTYRRMVRESTGELADQNLCSTHFRNALDRAPHHPRATRVMAYFMTDRAQQAEALEMLLQTLKERPKAWELHTAVAYAARTIGLLDGALRALRERDRVLGFPSRQDGLAENALLYAGEWEAFERTLDAPSGSQDPLMDFYRGYIRLLQDRREEALPFFRAAAQSQGSIRQFEELAQIYVLALENRREEALAALTDLRTRRSQVRIPDGEFTFKLAEAFALVGERDQALETVLRARTHGFTCAPWYERTPLLKPLHELPQWKALLAGLKERQAMLEQRFPASRFGR